MAGGRPSCARYVSGELAFDGRRFSRTSPLVEPADVEALTKVGVAVLDEHAEGGVVALTLLRPEEVAALLPDLQSSAGERRARRRSATKRRHLRVAELWHAPSKDRVIVLHDAIVSRDANALERLTRLAEHGDRASKPAPKSG